MPKLIASLLLAVDGTIARIWLHRVVSRLLYTCTRLLQEIRDDERSK